MEHGNTFESRFGEAELVKSYDQLKKNETMEIAKKLIEVNMVDSFNIVKSGKTWAYLSQSPEMVKAMRQYYLEKDLHGKEKIINYLLEKNKDDSLRVNLKQLGELVNTGTLSEKQLEVVKDILSSYTPSYKVKIKKRLVR